MEEKTVAGFHATVLEADSRRVLTVRITPPGKQEAAGRAGAPPPP